MVLHNIVIEVTRKCNMACSHCLRGEQQKLNIDYSYIDSLLSQVESIGNVTFSGGEPSLNTEAIEYFLLEIKKRNISLDSFYIATNGKIVNEAFSVICLKLFSYSDEKEMCQVDLSNDYFHAQESNYDTSLLDGLSFFSRKHAKEAEHYKGINQGFYEENYGDGRELDIPAIYTQDDFNDSTIYLNCEGNIIPDCDLSYKNQNNHVLCHVSNLKDYYNNLENLD